MLEQKMKQFYKSLFDPASIDYFLAFGIISGEFDPSSVYVGFCILSLNKTFYNSRTPWSIEMNFGTVKETTGTFSGENHTSFTPE